MNLTDILVSIAIGIGATATIDAWALMLGRAFDVRSLDLCLLGRWVLHMPDGQFVHGSIASATRKSGECAVGWTTHYLIGVAFAVVFVTLVSVSWLARPTLLPALAFGIVTVLVPFLTLQPALGLGIASANAPHPWNARLRSLATHAVFGAGLWMWAWVIRDLVTR